MIRFRALAASLALGALLGAATISGASPARAQGYPYPPVPGLRFEGPPPPPPGPRFVWEPGHWQWDGYRYAWIGGHYIPAGPRYAHFIHGHWANSYGRWVWVPGHWQ
jgi:hypothetical protein